LRSMLPLKILLVLSVLLGGIWCSTGTAFALQAKDLLLIVNRNSAAGLELARYYQQQRQVPEENLLQVRLPETEQFSREEYQKRLVKPLRKFLSQRSAAQPIRCLLLFPGIPLRVEPAEPSHAEWKALNELKFRKKGLDWQLKNSELTVPERQSLNEQSEQLAKEIASYDHNDQLAAVDSELSLALNDDYPLEKWLANPYFVGFQQQLAELPFSKEQVLLVARLDGPTPQIARRMLDDSLRAEAEGLTGKAYFDARWPRPEKKHLNGYALYDASLHQAAELTTKLSWLPVVLDERARLFQPGEAPDAALYCGWYSLAKYVDAFDWRPGAVAFHIASSECTTLTKPGSQVWCKRLLEDGAAATIGPVAEPYVQGFPLPEVFFNFLLDGHYTLVESYYLSLPYLSWRMILLGDPLYRPFRTPPDINRSPVGSAAGAP
jgi:uncharacterized protein (TIGR03790 family)